NLALDKHRASFDQTHRFITNFIYELPFGTGRRWLNSGFAPLRKAAEGWTVGTIITKQSGSPIWVTSGRSTFNQFTTAIGAQFAGSSFNDFVNNAGVVKTASGVFFFDPKMLTLTNNSSGATTAASLNSGLLT